MSRRQHATRLRENTEPALDYAGEKVIDAKFQVVGKKRFAWLGKVWMALVAVFTAALIGFLIPPLWIILREIFPPS